MSTTATVETLTAEVRVLMVGNRQVTLSVFRQLDFVYPTHIYPFGRVNDNRSAKRRPMDDTPICVVVGATSSGALVRSWIAKRPGFDQYRSREEQADLEAAHAARWTAWNALPLIVLAGLR